jgi:hypothetical protein
MCALLMIGSQAHAKDLNPAERHKLVRYQGISRIDWSVKENLLTIRAAFHRYGMNDGEARCVAMRESRYDNEAYNRSSGASGLFQFLYRYWPDRRAAYNRSARVGYRVGPSPFNARANALVAAWTVKHYGWSPWSGGC